MRLLFAKSKIFNSSKEVLLKNLTTRLFFLWSFTIFFPKLYFIFYIFCSISILKIFLLKEFKKSIFLKENLLYFFVLLFILWNIISLSYSEDIEEGLKRIEKLIPIFLISLISIFSDKRDFYFQKGKDFYLYGALLAIVVSLFFVCYQYFNGHLKAVAIANGIIGINYLSLFEHRLYIGILLLMTIPIIFSKIFTNSLITKKIIWISILFILFFVIYSTGARMLVLIFAILSIFLLFNELKKRIRKQFFYPLLLVGGLLLMSIVYLHPRTNLTIYLIKNNKELHKIDSRIRIWESSYELWLENIFLGKGIGDAKNNLLKKYQNKEYLLEYEKEYNAHNQFLQTSIQSGVIGLFLLCSLLLSFLFIKKRNSYISCFLIVLTLSFLIESVLNRNLGTFVFSYWIFIISIFREDSNDKKTLDFSYAPQVFMVLSIFVLSLLYFSNKSLIFNPKNPQTYLTIPFKEIEYKLIPKKEQLPEKTNAGLIYEKEVFKKFEYGYFLSPEIYSGYSDEYVNINYGIWCYVSEDSNVRNVYAYGWNKIDTEYKIFYNFNKKGSWQYLQLSDMKFLERFSMGVRLDLYRETNELKGKVLLALPNYKEEKFYNKN